MATPTLKDQWSLYAVVADLVRAIAKLATASAITNGRLPTAEGLSEAMLDEVLGQLDHMLVLGTHLSTLAEGISAGSGAVQRLRSRIGKNDDPVVSLQEVREALATLRLQRVQAAQEGNGPDTERSGSLDASLDQED